VGSGNLLTTRRSERMHVRMPVTLCVDSKGQSKDQTVFTADFSNNGIRVFAKAGLVPGQAVAIVVSSEQPVTLPGRVVWTGPTGTCHDDQAGIEFLRPVTPPV